MWWEKPVEIVTTQFPVAVLFAALAFIVFRYQSRLHQRFLDTQQAQFGEERKRIDASHALLKDGLQKLLDEGRRDRDALRKERNSLRRELGKPTDED